MRTKLAALVIASALQLGRSAVFQDVSLSNAPSYTSPSNAPPLNLPAIPFVAERGASFQIWKSVARQTNQVGRVTYRTNSAVELGSGMNYRTNGQWLPSHELIRSSDDGA